MNGERPRGAFELAPDGSTLHRRLELWYRKRLQEIEEDFSAEELSEAEYDAALDELHELFGRESERLTTMAVLLDLPAGAAPGSAPSPARKERRKLTAEEGFEIWIRSPAAERLLRDFAGARAVAKKVWPEAWRASTQARTPEKERLQVALREVMDQLEGGASAQAWEIARAALYGEGAPIDGSPFDKYKEES